MYWQLYDLAQSKELPEVIDKLTRLVDEAGDPWLKARRGRRPVHSARKMAVICILTVILRISYRSMQTLRARFIYPRKFGAATKASISKVDREKTYQ